MVVSGAMIRASQVLVAGTGRGQALVLSEPLSLWGGLDPETGEIIDRRHPSSGANLAGKVLVLPAGRGSSSASSILLESVRSGKGPAAIITREPDAILALGAAVAREMYAAGPPVLALAAEDYDQIRDGRLVTVTEAGVIILE
jgi:predicted aconitase with swiveling domain